MAKILSKPTKYDPNFVRNVVNIWANQNARASAFLDEELGLSKTFLELLLLKGDPLWDSSKRLAKDFVSWEGEQLGLGKTYQLPLTKHLLGVWLKSASESLQKVHKELVFHLDWL